MRQPRAAVGCASGYPRMIVNLVASMKRARKEMKVSSAEYDVASGKSSYRFRVRSRLDPAPLAQLPVTGLAENP